MDASSHSPSESGSAGPTGFAGLSGGPGLSGVPGPSSPPRTSRLAIASLVLGVLSLLAGLLSSIPWIAWLPASLAGIVCGVGGLIRIGRSEAGPGPRLTGRGYAIAGIVLSSVAALAVPVMLLLLVPIRSSARDAAAVANISQLSLAMAMAERRVDGMPAAIIDSDGKQLLSWRVAVLPFLGDEAAALFREFHLDEPWDSDHNRSLLGRMPAVYAAAGEDPSGGMTGTVVPVGPGTAMSDPEPLMAIDESERSGIVGIRQATLSDGDGAAVTVMMLSLPGLRIPWTQPADLVGDPADAFATMREEGVSRVLVGMADGCVRRLRTDLAPEQVRALFSRNGRDFVTEASLGE